MIAVLFARDDSRYKELDGYDVYETIPQALQEGTQYNTI